MATDKRRTVITGLGVLTAAGTSPEKVWETICHGQTGITPLQHVDPAFAPIAACARIHDFDAKKFITNKEARKSLKVMARTIQMGVSASQMAMESLGFGEKNPFDPDRFGIEYGCSMVASDLDDIAFGSRVATAKGTQPIDYKVWGTEGIPQVPPLWMLKYLPNMPACHVSIMHNARGPNNSLTASDIASLQALGEASRIIERNRADVFLVGGTESKLNPLSLSRHCTFQALTHEKGPAHQLLLPYQKSRKGTVLGEGAATLIVEEATHAAKAGRSALATVAGFASGCDPERDGKYLSRTIERALKDAGITAREVDHVNSAGAGFIEGDAFEARGIAGVFGKNTPVVSYKPVFGATGAASGLIEVIPSILAMQKGQLPPMLNGADLDPELHIQLDNQGMPAIRTPYFVKISMTDIGQIAVAVFRGPQA